MALHVAAQDKVKLSGRVIDDEQNPVLFAVVKVDGQAAGTTTDLQGRYQLEFSTADTVTVSFSMIGYVTKKKTLVRPKGSLRLNITLQTQSIDMGEVTVKEVRRQMNSTQHLNAENLKRLPSTTGNAVEELVATQAGVSTHNELSSQYNVRGGSFDENSVYINGVEVYRPMLISSGQQEGLSVINSDMVESINFSAGGFDAKYGDKMSSVLDITYKKPKKFEASVSASLLGAGLYVGYAKKNFSMTHGVRYKTNQYMLGSLETKGEYSPRFLDYQTYISWSPNKRWSLDFIGNISQNQYDFLPTNRQTNFGTMQDVKSFRVYFDGKEEDLFRTLFGTLSLSHSFTDRTKLSLLASAFATKERETYDIQGQYWLDETNTTEQLGVGTYMEHARNYLDANMKSLKVLFSHKPKGHDIQTGLTWKHEIIEENSREWEMRDSAGYSIPHTGNRLDLIYNLKSSNRIGSDRLELFGQDTWRFTNSHLFPELRGTVKLLELEQGMAVQSACFARHHPFFQRGFHIPHCHGTVLPGSFLQRATRHCDNRSLHQSTPEPEHQVTAFVPSRIGWRLQIQAHEPSVQIHHGSLLQSLEQPDSLQCGQRENRILRR